MTEGDRKLNDLRAKVDKGYIPTEEEQLDLIGSIFDTDLPIKSPK